MSKELFSSIDIDAPAETVWQILIDFAAFPTWNPFIVGAEGRAQVGERVTLRMQPVVGSAITLHPTVVELVEGRRLRWQGRLGLRGLFDADHLFIVEPSPSRSPGSSNVSASPAHLYRSSGAHSTGDVAGVSGYECGDQESGREGDCCRCLIRSRSARDRSFGLPAACWRVRAPRR